jgi:DNA-directed RNA polymerase specialized sigma subunit
MKKELSVKQIFDDFINKTIINDLEKQVLIKYIKNESIVKIAEDLSISTASVSRIIAEIKDKYNNYKKLEIAKLMLLQ